MKRFALISALAVVVASANAGQFISGVDGVISSTYQIGQPMQQRVASPGSVYSDVTTFSGFAGINGGATSTTTGTIAVADDLNMVGATGNVLQTMKFSMANLNTVAVASAPVVTLWKNDGTGGGPGTGFLQITFNPITINAGSVSVVTFSGLGAFNITAPQNNVWASVNFTSATATVAQLNNMGQGLFSPADVGTSLDRDFVTTAAGTPGNNPGGTIRTAPFTTPADYGWEFTAAPEPASMAVLGLGALAVIRRRRNKRS